MRTMRDVFDITTVKFLAVGVINTLVGTATMFVMYNLLNAGYWIASASNYVVGSIVSYILNKRFTFQNDEKSVGIVLKFVLNITVCYMLAYGIAKPCAYQIFKGFSVSIRENLAMLIGMCLFVALNYLGQRFFVFIKKDQKK